MEDTPKWVEWLNDKERQEYDDAVAAKRLSQTVVKRLKNRCESRMREAAKSKENGDADK